MAMRSEGRQSLMDSEAHGRQALGNSRNKTTNLLYTCMKFSDNKENIMERELFDLKGAFDQEIKVSAFDVY